MKAIAVNPKARQINLIDFPEPTIKAPTQVKLRMLEVGICGTDREICAFEYGTPPAGSDVLILGHESLGQVIEVGSAVRSLQPGDLVVPTVRRPCNHESCTACREGRQDYCYTGEFTERGINSAHGFMTELVVEEQQNLNLVPPTLRDVAVLVEPLTIAEKGMAQVECIQARLPWGCPVPSDKLEKPTLACRRAVVLGAGPVGLLGAMALVERGFETFVYARESAESPKAVFARAIGATYASAAETTLAELAARVRNIDLFFEATGASRLSFDALGHLGANGVFVLTGVPGRRGPVEIDTDLLMRNLVLKNQVLCGTVNAGKENFQSAIRDLAVFKAKWPKAVSSLITGRSAISSARELLTSAPKGIKEVIALGDEGR